MSIQSYIIMSAACLAVSYACFRLLRNDSMFIGQRIFILVSVVLSAVFPLIHIKMEFPGNHGTALAFAGETGIAPAGITESARGIAPKIAGLVPYIYIMVTLVIILTIIFQLTKILWLYSVSERKYNGRIVVLRSRRIKEPFSFFRWIFIPDTIEDITETENIIIHETIHARQLHTLDNIILELACALMWFNPVIWMMKKSMHLIHEYIADKGTLDSGVEILRYQAQLVNRAAEENLVCIPSNFNNNLLKKRMIMMTKNKNSFPEKLRLMPVIPLPVVLLLVVTLLNGLLPPDAGAQEKKKTDNSREITVIGYAAKEGTARKDSTKEITVIGYGKSKQADTLNYIVDGVAVKSIDDIDPNSIESVKVLKEDRTIIIRTKKFAAGFKSDSVKVKIAGGLPARNVLILVDGKEVSRTELESYSPAEIGNINVIKDKDLMKKYTGGDYDGIIIVTKKK